MSDQHELNAVAADLDDLAERLRAFRLPPTRTTSPDLLGVAEWADECDASGSTVSNWIRRGRMPEPYVELRCGPIWTREQLEAWAGENDFRLKSTTSRRNGTRRKSR